MLLLRVVVAAVGGGIRGADAVADRSIVAAAVLVVVLLQRCYRPRGRCTIVLPRRRRRRWWWWCLRIPETKMVNIY